MVPADGRYTVRLRALSYGGGPGAVYRRTLGEVAYATHVFPAGGQRGKTVEVEPSGPGVASGVRQQVSVPAADPLPVQQLVLDGPGAGPISRSPLQTIRAPITVVR
jgi:hypothetical protein